MVVAEETDKILMRTSQEEDQEKCYLVLTNPEVAILMMGLYFYLQCSSRLSNSISL